MVKPKTKTSLWVRKDCDHPQKKPRFQSWYSLLVQPFTTNATIVIIYGIMTSSCYVTFSHYLCNHDKLLDRVNINIGLKKQPWLSFFWLRALKPDSKKMKKKKPECDPYPFGHKLNWKWYKDNVFNVLPHQPNGLLYLSAYCEFDAISNKLVQGQQQTGKVVEWPQITCLEQVSSCFYLLRWGLLSERHAILLLTA